MLKFISEFEIRLQRANTERASDGLPPLSKVHLKVLGQMALMANIEASSKLHLVATKDLDAIIEGDWTARTLLKNVLQENGMVYDELSSEVWIPPEATFEVMHDSSVLKVSLLSPLFVLASKAVKAPQKNKQLITQAIEIWGEELIDLISEHGQDIRIFLNDK